MLQRRMVSESFSAVPLPSAATGAGGGPAVGEHHYDARIGAGVVKEPGRLAEGVGVVGVAHSRERVYRVFQRVDAGYELRVGHGSVCKAHYAYTATRTYLTVGGAAGRLGYDVNERLGSELHICHRLSRHAPGAVENQCDVGGIGHDVRRRGERQRHAQRAVAVDEVGAYKFVGIGYTNVVPPFESSEHPIPRTVQVCYNVTKSEVRR